MECTASKKHFRMNSVLPSSQILSINFQWGITGKDSASVASRLNTTKSFVKIWK